MVHIGTQFEEKKNNILKVPAKVRRAEKKCFLK